jgi:Phosphodiester glycosidase/FlgD Ig-like domain
LLIAALAVLLASPAAAGGATRLFPGVTYERQVRTIGGGPVVLHIMRMPRHGGLYSLRPVLSGGTVTGQLTVPAMQKRLASRATVAGVNADFFTGATGAPNGAFLRDGVLSARPHPRRSSLGIGFDGRLLVDFFHMAGAWWVPGGDAHPIEELNRPLLNPPGVALYTRNFAARTPRFRGAREIVFTRFPRAHLNGWLQGTVAAVRRGGGTAIPPGGAVMQARGFWRPIMAAQARPGVEVTVRLRIPGIPDDVADLIGGGPVLVRNGNPLRRPDEAFLPSHFARKHPRTAVGQRADGRLLFVVAEGRRPGSIGLTHWELAQQMDRLGAVTAMGFDGGGSSTMAFNGRVLNRPSDGRPRAVASGLFVFYYGIYAPRVPRRVLTPNRDGVSDTTVASAKVVRRASVVLSLLRPNGTVAWRFSGLRNPGVFRHGVGVPGMAEGRWRWVAEATESVSGRVSRMERSFVVNRTLGHLRLAKERMRVVSGRGGSLRFTVGLTRRSTVTVSIRSSSGRVVRVLHRGSIGPGRHAWRWGGRNAARKVVPSGTYAVRIAASNILGTVALADAFRVVRVAG